MVSVERQNLQVDVARCNRCGLCLQDCPARIIEWSDHFPHIQPEKAEFCIHCQHCLAICPEAALSIDGYAPETSLPLDASNLPRLEAMELLMRGRRSHRHYLNQNVDPSLIQRLLETLSHAPTGVNCRKLSFTVIQDGAVLAVLRTRILEAMIHRLESGQAGDRASFLEAMTGPWKAEGRDIIFRGAPHLLLVSAPPDTATPQQDVDLTLAYFELLAQSAGLGTVWCGLLKRALESIPSLKAILSLPADHIYYAMLFGYPALSYARTTQRQDTALVRILDSIP